MAVKVDTDKCDACESYAEECPVDAISIEDIAIENEKECIDYNTCVAACPDDAIEL